MLKTISTDMSRNYLKAVPFFLLMLLLPLVVVLSSTGFKITGRAREVPANIVVDASNVIGPLPYTWKALAQGGEEQGVRMLGNVVSQTAALGPRYIRLDHLYDFYNVVNRDSQGNVVFTWNSLDETICDILNTGAKPFLSLGYMPVSISKDGTVIGAPTSWDDWAAIVQATIERYSGQNTMICPGQTSDSLSDVYYEVWNEPDLESFGKWSIHGGEKDYKLLYFWSAEGAKNARNTKRFFLGGPATTRPYQNWMQVFLKYASALNLRVDFISWHHYSPKTDDFSEDMVLMNQWLDGRELEKYKKLPRIISEWGYDSAPNPIANSQIAAAHTIATIRHLVDQKLEMAFAFEIKDGVTPSWGMLTRDGQEKPRYHGLTLLNSLGPRRLNVLGEGTWVQALGSRDFQKISLILVNYDESGVHSETVPVTFRGLTPSERYKFKQIPLSGIETTVSIDASDTGIISRLVNMTPNSAYALELTPQ